MRQQATDPPITLIPMHNLSDPATWDALQASRNWAHLLSQLPNDPSPVTLARRAQLYMLSDDPAINTKALPSLDAVQDCPPCTGMRLLILCQERQYEEVVATGYTHVGMTPLEREDACHAHAALAFSHSALRNSFEAYAHIRMALEHAQALGMHDRAQFLTSLHLNTLSNAGQPKPDQYRQLLLNSMPAGRRAYTIRGHAESIMASGDYRAALRVLGAPTNDDAMTAGLRAALTLSAGLPLITPADERSSWGTVALGIQRYFAGDNDIQKLRDITSEPAATVGRIISALMLCRGQQFDRYALRILGDEPVRADQRLAWRMTRWVIDHQNGRTDRTGYHIRAVEAAAQATKCPRALLSLLMRASPDLYVLLSHSPVEIEGLGEALVHVPLLMGDVILYGERRIPAPGRSGRMMVLDAMGLPAEELDPTEKRRFTKRVREENIPAPINMGWVVRTLHGEARSNFEEGWTTAVQDTVSHLTPSVQEKLSHHPL